MERRRRGGRRASPEYLTGAGRDVRHDEILRQFLEILKVDGRTLPENLVEVLKVFMGADRHFTSAELNEVLHREGIEVTDDQVTQILDLARDYGLAREHKFEDSAPSFEHLHPDEHHDHMICIKCGRIEEFANPQLEDLQQRVMSRYGFTPIRHRMELYGLCPDCRDKAAPVTPLCSSEQGATVEIVRLAGGRDFHRRLNDMGLKEGDVITVLKSCDNGPCVVAAGESRMGIGAGMAKKIIVRLKD